MIESFFSLYFDRQLGTSSIVFRVDCNQELLHSKIKLFKDSYKKLNSAISEQSDSLKELIISLESILTGNNHLLLISQSLKNETNKSIISIKSKNYLNIIKSELDLKIKTRDLFKSKIIFTQIQILNLKYMDIEIFLKDNIRDESLLKFLIKEITMSFKNDYTQKFSNRMNEISNLYESLFLKMQKDQSFTIKKFIHSYLELNIKKEELLINEVLYYYYASSYFLSMLEHFKNAYKRIKKNFIFIINKKEEYGENSFLKLLHYLGEEPILKAIKIKDFDILEKYNNHLLKNKESLNFYKIEIPLNFMIKVNKQAYLSSIISINKKEFIKIDHFNKKIFFSKKSDDHFSYINAIYLPSEFKVYKNIFQNFMTKEMTIEKKEVLYKEDKNYNIVLYDFFFNINLFNDSIEEGVAA